MPYQNLSAFAPLPEAAISGRPSYFFGSVPDNTADNFIVISNVALTSNVATITGKIQTGNTPVVGNLISTQGIPTSSGAFNVSAVPLTAVSVNVTTGVGTFSFALTHADVVSVASSGVAIIPIQEIGEPLVNGTSVNIYCQSNELKSWGARSITVATEFPTPGAVVAPTAATVTLYTAIDQNQAEWTSMGTVAVVAASAFTTGPLATFTTPAGRFFQVRVSGVAGGTNPQIICKMLY